MSGSPLPSRIVIPVANPLTAEELIRIGASLMDPRTNTLMVGQYVSTASLEVINLASIKP